MDRPGPDLRHLWRLTDGRAIIEHACGREPARQHGYCVDDVARALVLLSRRVDGDPLEADMLVRYLRFVLDAVRADGRVHNRMSTDGLWRDDPGTGDCWGRAIWGLGTVISSANCPEAMHDEALRAFASAARSRSTWLHASAFAILGASRLTDISPVSRPAKELVSDCAALIAESGYDSWPEWPWPEPRLRYASAAIPEALLRAGHALGDRRLISYGMDALRFLVALCDRDGHLSVPPANGRGPDEDAVGENQQPIEVAALADACAAAYGFTGDPLWRLWVARCWQWFLGDNDGRLSMIDWVSGGGFDGLLLAGRNPNQGAESTIAMLSTGHLAIRLGLCNSA